MLMEEGEESVSDARVSATIYHPPTVTVLPTSTYFNPQ